GDDAVHLAAQLGGLGEHAERPLLQGPFVVLEEDEDLARHQMSRFSARNATICSAALPSSSMRRASPRAGGAPSASTLVRDSAAPPTSAAESVSCGFFFAPMIPF